MLARCVATLKPPPELTLSQWADRYRMLSAESSAEPGRWHTDKAPYQREIMDAIGDAHIRRVVIMCAAQLGKTELLLNILGYFIFTVTISPEALPVYSAASSSACLAFMSSCIFWA